MFVLHKDIRHEAAVELHLKYKLSEPVPEAEEGITVVLLFVNNCGAPANVSVSIMQCIGQLMATLSVRDRCLVSLIARFLELLPAVEYHEPDNELTSELHRTVVPSLLRRLGSLTHDEDELLRLLVRLVDCVIESTMLLEMMLDKGIMHALNGLVDPCRPAATLHRFTQLCAKL